MSVSDVSNSSASTVSLIGYSVTSMQIMKPNTCCQVFLIIWGYLGIPVCQYENRWLIIGTSSVSHNTILLREFAVTRHSSTNDAALRLFSRLFSY